MIHHKNQGADGLVTLGLNIPAFMRASWFNRQEYEVVDKHGIMKLLFKPFRDQAIPPWFIKPGKKPQKGKGRINITILKNG